MVDDIYAWLYCKHALEYPTSWALEKLFKARWWDYSDMAKYQGKDKCANITCIGLLAILAMEVLIPLVDRGLSFYLNLYYLSCLLYLFLLFQ